MFVSGFNISLQVAVSIQLQLYRELCHRASNMTHMKSIQDRFISRNLIRKSQMLHDKYQYYFDQVVLFLNTEKIITYFLLCYSKREVN